MPVSKKPRKKQPKPVVPHVTVTPLSNGQVQVNTVGLSEMMVPTLLKLAAKIVERKLTGADE